MPRNALPRAIGCAVIAQFWHWAKVASEVARLSPVAEMHRDIVEGIIDEES